jgi:hypothetical protein
MGLIMGLIMELLVGGLEHLDYFSIGNFIIPTDEVIFLEG